MILLFSIQGCQSNMKTQTTADDMQLHAWGVQPGMNITNVKRHMSRRVRQPLQCSTQTDSISCKIKGYQDKPFIFTFATIPVEQAIFHFYHDQLQNIDITLVVYQINQDTVISTLSKQFGHPTAQHSNTMFWKGNKITTSLSKIGRSELHESRDQRYSLQIRNLSSEK